MEGGEARKKALLRAKKENGKICYRRNCNKAIVVPMKCDECARVFCPSHRHKSDHSCTPTPMGSGANTPVRGPVGAAGAKAAMSRLLSNNNSNSSSSKPTPVAAKPRPNPVAAVQAAGPQIEARAAAAAAAMKRAGQDAKVPFVKTKTEK
jgi:predicted nucleic acid binding AN1-type Zn finger protein